MANELATRVRTGELGGSVTRLQCPAFTTKYVKIKALADNPGNVYVGGSDVTTANDTTDVTTGLQLAAGEETGWMPLANLGALWYVCDSADDSATYMVLL